MAEKGGSKTDTLVKVVLVFFISLLSFSVGTFVGKQVVENEHRRMALEGEFKGGDRNVASEGGGKEGGEAGGEKISDKEVESLTEEFVNKEKTAGAGGAEGEVEESSTAGEKSEKGEGAGGEKVAVEKGEKSEKGEKTEKVEKAEKTEAKVDAGGYKSYPRGGAKTAEAKPAAHDAEEKIAEKVAEGKAPTDGMKEERKPSSTLPSVASSAVGKYTVQVGSYADEKEAKSHAAELKGKGWNAFYFSAAVQGRTWYRVSVGLFNNMNSAKEFRAQFMKDAGTKSAIVQKIVQ